MVTKIGDDFCQYYYADFQSMTGPDLRRALRLKKIWWKWKRYAWYAKVMGPNAFLKRHFSSGNQNQSISGISGKSSNKKESQEILNLEPGELVEVRSEKEILATLDRNDKLRGMRYFRELSKHCGKKYKVYKKLKNIVLEDTGEMRTIKSPTVLLEDVICDGSFHAGCDRSCFCYWREEWLKRADQEDSRRLDS
jgi:hypothetical protein